MSLDPKVNTLDPELLAIDSSKPEKPEITQEESERLGVLQGAENVQKAKALDDFRWIWWIALSMILLAIAAASVRTFRAP